MTPLTRFGLDAVCWFGTAGLLAYWNQPGWAMIVGLIGAVYLGWAWTILGKINELEDEDDYV